MKLWRYGILFYIGGLLYTCLELLWRGWSHWSMFLAGGLCFLLIGHLHELRKPVSKWVATGVGVLIILIIELAAGLLFNTDYQVWDYRNVPLNFLGQICLPYTILWVPLSFGANLIYVWLSGCLSEHLIRAPHCSKNI